VAQNSNCEGFRLLVSGKREELFGIGTLKILATTPGLTAFPSSMRRGLRGGVRREDEVTNETISVPRKVRDFSKP